MAAGSTYTPIQTTTLGSASSSVTLSSISGSYTDLVLVISGLLTSGTAQDLQIRFNGDTATNYSWTALNASGSAKNSNRDSNTNVPRLGGSYGAITTDLGNWIVSINNYSNTTTYKNYLSRGNNAYFGLAAVAGLWRSTSAINSITIFPSGSTIASGSTFTLYGIAAA